MTSTDEPPTGGRFVAWAGFAFGLATSIAANVLYTWIPQPPAGVDPKTWVAPEGWEPSVAAQFGAAAWPVALLLAVEGVSRVQWRAGWQWKLARYGGAGVVALGAAIISYGHLNGVLLSWGYDALGAAVGPLVIDGLMTVSGFALLSMSDRRPATQTGTTDQDIVAEQPAQPESIDDQVAAFAAELDQPIDDEPVSDNVDDRGLSLLWNTAPLALVPAPVVDVQPESEPQAEEPKPERPTGDLAQLIAKYGVDHDRTMQLLANGAGRPTLVQELGVSDHRARQLVAAKEAAAS